MAQRQSSDRNIPAGILAGIAGGLVGSIVMKGLMLAGQSLRRSHLHRKLDQSGPAHQVAELAGSRLLNRPLTVQEHHDGGELVHYLFGAVVGGIYGGLSERWTWVRLGTGSLFGVGVFLAADESSMPMLGLVPKPTDEPLAAQVEHLAVHLAFGVTTETVRKLLR